MIRRILVGLDGTELSERSLPWVLRIAPRAKIVLGSAYTPIPIGSDPWMDAFPYAFGDETARTYLRRIAAELQPAPRVVIGMGSPAGALLDMAQKEHCDLLTITSHGGATLKRRMFGGTAEKLIHHSTIPLMVIPAAGPICKPKARVRRIAIPLDGSHFAESILPLASQIALEHKAELLLIHCFLSRDQMVQLYESWGTPALSPVLTQDLEHKFTEYRAHLEKYFTDLSLRLRRRRLRVKVVLVTGNLPEGIVRAALRHRADLFMMCAHGHGALRHLLQGSLVSQLIQTSAVPVIVLREDGKSRGRKVRPERSKKAGKKRSGRMLR